MKHLFQNDCPPDGEAVAVNEKCSECFGDSPLRWESGPPLTVWAADREQKDAWQEDAWALKHPVRTSMRRRTKQKKRN